FLKMFARSTLLGVGLVLTLANYQALAARPIGIDVSDYQSASINWSTLKNTYGISFGWAKISEGGSSAGGSHFTTYAANAKADGHCQLALRPYHRGIPGAGRLGPSRRHHSMDQLAILAIRRPKRCSSLHHR